MVILRTHGRKGMAETFQTMIQKERERLEKARADAESRLKNIQDEIAGINREFEAIEAYERVKTGKTQQSTKSKESDRKRASRGSRQEELRKLLRDHPDGLTRGEILERLKSKGDKKSEASVSNALANMK